MKEYLTANEIAEARLPDLPWTKSAVIRRAEREAWDSHPAFARRRKGRGGGMEYSYRILPTLAQIEYFQRHELVGQESRKPENQVDEVAVPPANGTNSRALKERDARLAIIAAFDRFSRGQRLRRTSRQQVFCDKYNIGTLAIDAWIKDLVPAVSKRSLDRWIALQKQGKPIGYDPGQSRRGTSVLERANDGRVAEWMLALVAFEPHLSCEDIQTQCRHKFGDSLTVAGEVVPMPPVRSFQRVLKGLKASNQVLLTKITNPDRYRSHMKPSGTGSYRHLSEPNALWMIDASPVDALCVDGRHSLYACIDVATRRFVITVARTPRASAVALMIRKASIQLGVPVMIKTDNGSDFVARDTRRLLDNLKIEVDVCAAYSPEQKGHVERAIKSFQHMVGPSLPGFIGHSVSDRKAIEERKSFAARLGEDDAKAFSVSLTAAELQGHIDKWLEIVYQHRSHAGLGDRTPFAVAAASPVRPRMVDERAFDMLLMPVPGNGTRQVTKQGIRIANFYYGSPDLMPAQQVFVRMDPLDLGKVFVFSPDGAEFLSEAICPELAGVDPAVFHQARRELFAERMKAAERGVRADMSEIALQPLIEKMLEVKARDVPNVIALPKAALAHTSPQIEAAIAAMSPQASVPLDDDVSALHAELMSDFAEPAPQLSNVTALRATLTPAQLYRKALDLETRMEAGEVIDPTELLWLGGFRQSAAYQTQREMHEDFGDHALS